MIRILLIDDEPEVRDLLKILLRSYAGAEVIGEASNVDEAVVLTRQLSPDLVLLDIQMPEKDGFDYIKEMGGSSEMPGVIFATAFENYAIDAIRHSAFDYLLKPLQKRELFQAIDRFSAKRRADQSEDMKTLVALLSKHQPGRIKLNTRTGFFFVDPGEILYIAADGNYSEIRLAGGNKELSTIGIGQLEKMLEPYPFMRISRSYIINLKFLTRVDRKSNLCDLECPGEHHQLKIAAQKIRILEQIFQ